MQRRCASGPGWRRNAPVAVVSGTDVRGVPVDEIFDVQLLRQGEHAVRPVAAYRKSQHPLELAAVVHGEALAQVGYETRAEILAVVNNDAVVNVHEDPQDESRSVVGEQAGIDGRADETPGGEEGGEENTPLASGLLEAIKGTVEAAHEGLTFLVEGGDPGGHAHVELLGELGLEVRLADVDLGEVIVAGSGDDEDQADGGRLDHSCKDAVVIDPELLRVTVGHEACLELVHGAIAESLDVEHVVAVHQVAATRD